MNDEGYYEIDIQKEMNSLYNEIFFFFENFWKIWYCSMLRNYLGWLGMSKPVPVRPCASEKSKRPIADSCRLVNIVRLWAQIGNVLIGFYHLVEESIGARHNRFVSAIARLAIPNSTATAERMWSQVGPAMATFRNRTSMELLPAKLICFRQPWPVLNFAPCDPRPLRRCLLYRNGTNVREK